MDKKTTYQKFIIAKKNFKPVIRNKQAYGYKYAPIENYIDAAFPALWEQDLDCLQLMQDNKITTCLVNGETGEQIILAEANLISVPLAKGNEIQAWGAGVTYVKRYCLATALGMATEDDDGQTTSNIVKKPDNKPAPQKIELASETDIQELANLINQNQNIVLNLFSAEDLQKIYNAISSKKMSLKGCIESTEKINDALDAA